jgi:hypothetical protein
MRGLDSRVNGESDPLLGKRCAQVEFPAISLMLRSFPSSTNWARQRAIVRADRIWGAALFREAFQFTTARWHNLARALGISAKIDE